MFLRNKAKKCCVFNETVKKVSNKCRKNSKNSRPFEFVSGTNNSIGERNGLGVNVEP